VILENCFKVNTKLFTLAFDEQLSRRCTGRCLRFSRAIYSFRV